MTMESIMQLDLNHQQQLRALFPKLKVRKPAHVEFEQNDKEKITVATREAIHLINPDCITRCKSYGNYCKIFMVNQKSILISKTLKYVSELIGQKTFVRVHQSHLINRSYISKINKTKQFSLEMTDGTIIPVSRSQKKNLKNFLHNQ